MTAVIIGIDDVAGCVQEEGKTLVAQRMFGRAMRNLHHGLDRDPGFWGPFVDKDLEPLRVFEVNVVSVAM